MAIARKRVIYKIDILRENPNRSFLRSAWLEEYFSLMIALIESKINPIAVFDGTPFKLKTETAAGRKEKFQAREKEIAQLRAELQEMDENHVDYRKKFQRLRAKLEHHIWFTPEDWAALKEMFNAMGVSMIEGEHEAEAKCARLVRRGYASAVVSNDADTLAHLAPIMIMRIKRSYKLDQPFHKCECIVLSEVLKALNLGRRQFVEFCMLIGTDYNKRIKGYGFVKALKLMQKHGNLEAVLAELATKPSVDIAIYRLANYALREAIRDYFLNELDFEVERRPVFYYTDGLINCLDEHLAGPNREAMLKKAEGNLRLLKDFNQEFAKLQKFELVLKTDDLENSQNVESK